MTQTSRPQAEHSSNYPLGDSGPYTGNQWREAWEVLFTGSNSTTQGPIFDYLNELAVTLPAPFGVNTFTVETGAGIVAGTLFINDAQITFSSPAPAADRPDIVVIVENNTNAVYNTNLAFPTVLTDYSGLSSIPAYSARIAILLGVEGGAARALVQTNDIFMVPLHEYTTLLAGGVGAGDTDAREYAGSKTAQLFYPALGGWNVTDGTTINPGGTAANEFLYGLEMITGKVSQGVARCNIPTQWDEITEIVVNSIYMATGVGDVRTQGGYYAGIWAGGTAWNGQSDTLAISTDTTVANEMFGKAKSLNLGFAKDLVLTVMAQRTGTDGADTYAGDLYFRGVVLEITSVGIHL